MLNSLNMTVIVQCKHAYESQGLYASQKHHPAELFMEMLQFERKINNQYQNQH
jgi:hypothetical protein